MAAGGAEQHEQVGGHVLLGPARLQRVGQADDHAGALEHAGGLAQRPRREAADAAEHADPAGTVAGGAADPLGAVAQRALGAHHAHERDGDVLGNARAAAGAASRLIAAAMRVASDGVIGRNGADTVSAAG